jgi:hypothetical protein
MAVVFRVTEEQDNIIRRYAAEKHLSVSDVARAALLEKIEDEYDYQIAAKALEEHRKNPITHTHEEVWLRLDRL